MILKNQKPNYQYNKEVKIWQRDLTSVGYKLQIDGIFGDETEMVTKEFQKNMNISIDGIVGPQTRAAMTIKKNIPQQLYKKGSKGEEVKWIQKIYKDIGYDLEIDGIFGPITENITKKFQEDTNIIIDGIVGPETIGKLCESIEIIPTDKIKIFIDNGHEPGNVNGGKLGYKEWEGNLKSARYLKKILNNTKKFNIMLTYDWNKNASVRIRGNKAATWGAKLLFSIHSNAGGGSGSECYYSVDLNNDKKYAEAITEKISKEFSMPNRGAKVKKSKTETNEDYMGIIDSAQDGGVDHVLLVESMFHDNINEEELLLQDDTHKKLAKIYAEVILDIFDL